MNPFLEFKPLTVTQQRVLVGALQASDFLSSLQLMHLADLCWGADRREALQGLAGRGLLQARACVRGRVRVEYALTDAGRRVAEVFAAL